MEHPSRMWLGLFTGTPWDLVSAPSFPMPGERREGRGITLAGAGLVFPAQPAEGRQVENRPKVI